MRRGLWSGPVIPQSVSGPVQERTQVVFCEQLKMLMEQLKEITGIQDQQVLYKALKVTHTHTHSAAVSRVLPGLCLVQTPDLISVYIQRIQDSVFFSKSLSASILDLIIFPLNLKKSSRFEDISPPSLGCKI